MKHVRKFIVALVGYGIFLVGRRYGIDSAVYDDVVMLATAAGVYAVPNN